MEQPSLWGDRPGLGTGSVVLLLILAVTSCGDDNLLRLARAEADLTRDFSGASLSLYQDNERNFSTCAGVDCDDDFVYFKSGKIEFSLKLPASPSTPPRARITQCPYTEETDDRTGFTVVPASSDRDPFLCPNPKTVFNTTAMNGSGRRWSLTLDIPVATKTNAWENGPAGIIIDIGKRLNGRPIEQINRIFRVDTTPVTAPETYFLRQVKTGDGILVSSLVPDEPRLIFEFPVAMNTEVLPRFSMAIAVPLGSPDENGQRAPVYGSIIPYENFTNSVAWLDERKLVVEDIAASFGILPENNQMVWQLHGAETANGTALPVQRRSFVIGALERTYPPNPAGGPGANYATTASLEAFSISWGAFVNYEVSGSQDIIRDDTTGLLWTRCSLGQSGSDCSQGNALPLPLSDATGGCNALASTEFGGYSRWRVPTFRELFTLTDVGSATGAFDNTTFPNTAPTNYWTITFSPRIEGSSISSDVLTDLEALVEVPARTVNFAFGRSETKQILTELAATRCVTDEAQTDNQRISIEYETVTPDSGAPEQLYRIVGGAAFADFLWLDCSYGRRSEITDESGTLETVCYRQNNIDGVDFFTAVDFCSPTGIGTITLDGTTYTPRLPTLYEMEILEVYDHQNSISDIFGLPRVGRQYLPESFVEKPYWTASDLAAQSLAGYVFQLGAGVEVQEKVNPTGGYARCVFTP